MKLKQLFLLTFAIPVLLVPAVFTQEGRWEDDDYYETHLFKDHFSADLGGIDTVSITIVSGGIKVKTWAGDSIEIEVDEKVRKLDSSEAAHVAEEVRPVSHHSGSTLYIELDYGSLSEQYVHRHYSSVLTVTVPARLSLDLDTVNGCISVARMEGRIKVKSTNGSITLDGCAGNADLRTTNGEIRSGTVNGELYASSTNGDLELEGVGGVVEGNTTNGSISSVLMGAISGDVELETTNGSIELTIHPDSNFELEAHATNGRVRKSLSGHKFAGEFNRRRTRLEGEYGGGGHLVRLRTTNGRITIDEVKK